MPDLPDWSQSVSIDAATVTIPVSGSVSITSGSVTIANASIAVINASGTKITSARPPKLLGQWGNGSSNPQTTTFTLDSDVQGLVMQIASAIPPNPHIRLQYHASVGPLTWVPLELFAISQFIYAIPILPSGEDPNGVAQTTIELICQANALGTLYGSLWEVFEPDPLWLQLFPQPQLAPNQFPKTVILTLAALVAQWVIQSVANVQITLFNIVVMRYNPSVANDDFVLGYNATLPTNGNPVPNAQVLVDSTQTAASGTGPMFTIPLAGVQLPRGAGLFADTSLSGVANLWLLVEYSLS